MKKVAFLIINYNNSNITIASISTILSQQVDSGLYDIYVLDNNSNQNELSILRSFFLDNKHTNLFLNEGKSNLGYFPGFNFLFKTIERSKYSYFVISNNDLLYDQNFINRLLNLKSESTYPVICPNIQDLSNKFQNPHGLKHPSRLRELIYDVYYMNYFLSRVILFVNNLVGDFCKREKIASPENGNIALGFGACYILTDNFFKHFPCLWAPTFLMGEELCLSFQLESKGFKPYFCSYISVIHLDNVSISKRPSVSMYRISQNSHKTYRKFVNPLKLKMRSIDYEKIIKY